jgi:hypothetical protein
MPKAAFQMTPATFQNAVALALSFSSPTGASGRLRRILFIRLNVRYPTVPACRLPLRTPPFYGCVDGMIRVRIIPKKCRVQPLAPFGATFQPPPHARNPVAFNYYRSHLVSNSMSLIADFHRYFQKSR